MAVAATDIRCFASKFWCEDIVDPTSNHDARILMGLSSLTYNLVIAAPNHVSAICWLLAQHQVTDA